MKIQNARRYAQLGLLHTALALTTLPIDDTLNRVMRVELGLSLLLITFLVSLPHLLSPLQIAVGALADKHSIAGWRRTPYILLGLLAAAGGVALLPVGLYFGDPTAAIVITSFGFLLWGVGYTFTAVSYFALASELFGEDRRSRAVAVMYFMMLLAVIIAGISVSRMLDPFTPEALTQAIWAVAAVALALGLIGLLGLERRATTLIAAAPFSFGRFRRALTANPTARTFFVYMVVLLMAILGQDVLLEPFAGQALGMPVAETTRLRSIYGVCFLVALVFAALAERFLSKRRVVQAASVGGMFAFGMIAASGLIASPSLFYAGLVLLGLAIGLSVVANHSLMLDMTTPQSAGLFIGMWGMATSLARLSGSLLGGFVGDATLQLTANVGLSYAFVFGVQAFLLLLSLWLLRSIDVGRFQRQAATASLVERAATASGAS